MSLGIRSLHDSWTCGCFRCFVLLVPIADVKHCAEVCEWFLCIRMERRRARHALGEKGVAGDFACDRYWLGQILATPRIACHVLFIGSNMVHPRGVDSHGVSCVLDVILGSLLMYLNAKRLASAKELKGGMCDVFTVSFACRGNSSYIEVPFFVVCTSSIFLGTFLKHKVLEGRNDVTTLMANWKGPASVPLQLAIFVSFFTVLWWHRLSILGRKNAIWVAKTLIICSVYRIILPT